jgi:hypothetical protein
MYQLRRPDPRLAPFIEHYWFVRASPAQPYALTVDAFVDARADLVINHGVPYTRTVHGEPEVTIARSNLDAQRLRPIRIAQQGQVVLAGVRFHVGGLAPFVRRSLHEWTDRVVPVEEAFDGDLDGSLRDHDADEQARRFDAYFLERLRLTAATEDFLEMKARIEAGATRMDQLPIPLRRLDRLFRAGLGITPKALVRIVRFQRALTRLRHDPGCTLGQVAAEFGYSDHAHFVREHRRFAGVTPGQQVGYFPAGAPTDFSPNLVRFVQDSPPS